MVVASELARLESLIERAFGSLPIPPPETILGWMLNGSDEERWVRQAYGGRRYSEVAPSVLEATFLTHVLSPRAFAYYVGSAALAAARWPAEQEDALVVCFAYGEEADGTLAEYHAELDLVRAEALRETLAYVLEEKRRGRGTPELGALSPSELEDVARVVRALATVGRLLGEGGLSGSESTVIRKAQ